MAINHKALKAALKTLAEAPKAVEAADQRYQEELANIRANEKTGRYAPVSITEAKKQAKEKHDRIVKSLVDSMKPALQTVRENNDYTGENLSLDDPKLTNALNVIGIMGKNMNPNTQVNILSQFKGNPAALAVLEGAYRKNGLYFADMAKEMQKPISNQALNDMELVLAYFDHNVASHGIYNLEMARARWTHDQFAAQAARLGMDLSEEADPYEYALNLMRDKYEEESMFQPDGADKIKAQAQKWAMESAINEVKKAKMNGEDEASAFDRAVKHFNKIAEGNASANASQA